MSSNDRQLEFFKSLSTEAQSELLQSFVEVMKTKQKHSESTSSTPPPMKSNKRHLESPVTPYNGGERKVGIYL